ERVIAFGVNKGAYYTGAAEGGVLQVPGLWFAGQKDSQLRLQNITSFFTAGRRLGAPWCLAIEPDTGHQVGKTPLIGLPFLEAMIAMRLGPKGQNNASLLPVPTHAWVGDLSSHQIRPFSPETDTAR